MTSQPIDDSVRVVHRRPVEWLPYLLSLPALLVCVGILIPFVTALYYSTLRFRLNLPALKGFIWFGNYTNLLYDPEFWNTVSISYATPPFPSASSWCWDLLSPSCCSGRLASTT